MSELRTESTGATLGATVTGIELAHLDPSDWSKIESAFLEHAVLIFPGQHLTNEEQASFGRRFGELALERVPISNQRTDGSLRDSDDAVMRLLRGNEGWHTDSSYMPLSAKASILSCRQPPGRGGETAWADMRAAYEALDSETRERIADLEAYHSLVYSQARIGEDTPQTGLALAALSKGSTVGTAAAYAEDSDPPLRPLVKVHPATDRPALFIGRHAYGIPGLEPDESEKLLDELLEFACRPPRVYQHRWQKGDLVIWDNRCVLHRARPWNLSEPRVMMHTRVAGDPATELAS
jgi:alpha-ketoglutarate-dependent taurine dioxygenase